MTENQKKLADIAASRERCAVILPHTTILSTISQEEEDLFALDTTWDRSIFIATTRIMPHWIAQISEAGYPGAPYKYVLRLKTDLEV